MISKVGSHWVLKSKRTGRILGKFKTKAAAMKRERQIQFFKRRGK